MTDDNNRDHKRKIFLGELGELLAIKALVDHGFEKIQNLNDSARNHAFADIYAVKDENPIIISVKTRNKYQKKKTLNDDLKLNAYYKLLYENGLQKAEYAQSKFCAEPYWMAIQIDRYTFSIFMGSLSELNGQKAIPIKKCETGEIGQCLVKNRQHFFDYSYFGNQEHID